MPPSEKLAFSIPSSCQIGKDARIQFVNGVTCKYIYGYIEEYDPDKEFEKIVINLTEKYVNCVSRTFWLQSYIIDRPNPVVAIPYRVAATTLLFSA